jgi:hypothetical protein
MKLLFLDESGDHNLTTIDPQYPLFVLAGCVMEKSIHEEVLTLAVKEFKSGVLGNPEIILHYVDYTRNQGGFERMSEREFREIFYCGLNRIIRMTEFTLLACIIDKTRHLARYDYFAVDPYVLSMEVLVERFVRILKQADETGVVIAESRGAQLDNGIELAFLNFKVKGTRFFRPKEITERIKQFIIREKKDNVAGLQLADAVATPIGRRYLGRKNFYIDYAAIAGKFRKGESGKRLGYGLVILPKK